MKNNDQPSHALLRQRKFLLVLPLLTLPFITLAFWALGGGKTGSTQSEQKPQGLNPELPGARIVKDKEQSKLSFYQALQQDSLKLQALQQNDSYYSNPLLSTDTIKNAMSSKPLYQPYPRSTSPDGEENEEKVYEKLRQLSQSLNSELNTPAASGQRNPDKPIFPETTKTVIHCKTFLATQRKKPTIRN